jgi:hypothetical protein
LFGLLGVILYIATDHGTVKITGTDPQMKVLVDGREIHIENLGQPITIRSGTHKLMVTRDDLEVKTDTFHIQRGEERVLEVTYIPKRSLTERGGKKKAESPGTSVVGESKTATSTTHVPSPESAPPSRKTQPPSPQPAQVLTNSIGMTLVRIEPGQFLMGSPDSVPRAGAQRSPSTA